MGEGTFALTPNSMYVENFVSIDFLNHLFIAKIQARMVLDDLHNLA